MNKHAIAEKQPTKATDKFQLTASMKSSSSIQISKRQTEMLPIQMESVQGSADIAEIETMEISDITESHENQRSSSSNLEKLVQSREKLSEVVGQAEAETTLFSSEKIQTILDECIEKRVSPAVLALKYNVCVSTIRDWIKKSGRSLPEHTEHGRYLVKMSNFKYIDGYKDISPDKEIFDGLTNNERQMIIEDCTEKLISPSVLALKYKINAKRIRDLVTNAGRQLPFSRSYVVNLANYPRKMPWLLPSADQKKIKAIIDECIDKKISPSVLALKHSVNVKHINSLARSYGRILPDDYEIDLSNFKSGDMIIKESSPDIEVHQDNQMPERMPEKIPESDSLEKGLEIVDITEDAPDTDVQEDIFDMVDPDHQTSDLTGWMNNLCKTGGGNVKCLIPKCDVVFWTDGDMKQHMTKTHKMAKRL